MGVPNTTTFSLQDVVDEVNPTTDDLQDCFNDANSDYFDSTYSGSKNSLYNFRNYGSHNAVSYSLSISPNTVFINAYGGSASVTVTSLPTAGTWSIRSVSETWITASKINNTTLNISVSQQNPFEFHRIGNVILEHTSDSTVTKAVGVSQAGNFGGL